MNIRNGDPQACFRRIKKGQEDFRSTQTSAPDLFCVNLESQKRNKSRALDSLGLMPWALAYVSRSAKAHQDKGPADKRAAKGCAYRYNRVDVEGYVQTLRPSLISIHTIQDTHSTNPTRTPKQDSKKPERSCILAWFWDGGCRIPWSNSPRETPRHVECRDSTEATHVVLQRPSSTEAATEGMPFAGYPKALRQLSELRNAR